MLKQADCNICNIDNSTILYPGTIPLTEPATLKEWTSTEPNYASYHNIVKCNNCGLIYMNPIDSNTHLYEDVKDENYLKSWDERADTFRGLLKIVRMYTDKGSLLDIGTYGGIFLEVALQAGFDTVGLEVSKWGVEHSRKRMGAIVHKGTCCSLDLNTEFDVVTLWDVIEHLPDPSLCLNKINKHLKPDGVLSITTHNIDSLFARLAGKKYPWLMRFHLHHFSPKTISLLLRKNGFEPIVIRNFTKKFSIHYLINRFFKTRKLSFLKQLKIPVPTGDMMLVIAKKSMQ